MINSNKTKNPAETPQDFIFKKLKYYKFLISAVKS